MKIVRTLLILCILFFFSGCYESESPLSETPESSKRIDTEILGLWVKNGKEGREFLHIIQEYGLEHQPKMRLIHLFEPSSEEGGHASTEKYNIFPTVLEEQRVMNVQFPSSLQTAESNRSTPVPTTYWFYRYEVEQTGKGQELTVWAPKFESVKAAIGVGKVKGTVNETTWGRNIKLTDQPENLRRWIFNMKPEQEMEVFGRYRRVNID